MGQEILKFDGLSPYNPDLRSVRGVEIFRVGEWNGDKYTSDDLDEMISAFGTQGYSVPLKMGHDEVSGGQAYGWVERIYRIGDVLKADFKDIPAYVFDWVFVQHAYDQVSIEIYFNLKRDGKLFKRALKAIALLGAETPAVSGLAPLREAIFAPGADQFEKIVAASVKVAKTMPDPVKQVEPNADVAALTAKLTESATQVAELKAALEAQATQAQSLVATLATLTANQQATEITAKLDALNVPALREHFRHVYTAAKSTATKVKFFAEGKETERPLVEVVDEIVAHVNKVLSTVTGGRVTGSTPTARAFTGTSADPSVELADKTKKYMADNKLPNAKYGEAMQAVLASDADLASRYRQQANGSIN